MFSTDFILSKLKKNVTYKNNFLERRHTHSTVQKFKTTTDNFLIVFKGISFVFLIRGNDPILVKNGKYDF